MVQATKKRMKVLFVITKSNYGGAQRYVYDLATNVPSDDYEAVVVCGKADGATDKGLLITKLEKAGVRTIFLPALSRDVAFGDIAAAWQLLQILRLEKPDVVHLNSSKAGGIGALVARIAGVRRILFTAHGWAFRESRNPLVRTLIWLASVGTILLSHKVICVSTYDRDSFSGWFFDRKLIVIHNAIPASNLLSRNEAQRTLQPNNSHASDIWIGSIAELNANKNIGLALQAVARARSTGARIFYVVIGDGEERQQLEERAKVLGISEHVAFLGYVPDAGALVPAFDCVLITSQKEGLPYAILEALRAHVPVIASMTGGIPELIRDGVNGILCPHDSVDAFAQALEKFAKDDLLRAAFVKTIESEDKNTFDTMVRETTAVYSSLA